MAREANTPELWDDIWEEAPSPAQHRHDLAREERTIRWQRIEDRVRASLGGFRGLKAIEIGAGAGTNAAAMAKRGASVTLLDYSDRALARARDLFSANGVEAALVRGDALALPDSLRGQFDLAMSFGLNEHFVGAERVAIFESHLDVLRPGGAALISVPNALNPPYRAAKLVAEATGQWKVGLEVPFTHSELESICRRLGVSDFELFGDSFPSSFQFVNPWRYLRKRLGSPRAPDGSTRRRQRGTPLDARWSYATVLMMRKPGR